MTIAGVFRRFAPFDAQGKRDDNYGFFGQPAGEPRERSDRLSCIRVEAGKKIAARKGGGKGGIGLILRKE
jgi:hypothetical protein